MVEMVFVKYGWFRFNLLKGPNSLKKLGFLFFIFSIPPFLFFMYNCLKLN